MNENAMVPEERFDPRSSQAIDLMVDGELSEGQQQVLLAALEESEGGWRRLALAYVEGRCLTTEFRSLLPGPEPGSWTRGSVTSAAAASAGSKRLGVSSHRWWATLLAMAASFLIAFALGSWFHGTTNATGNAGAAGQKNQAVADGPQRSAGSAANAGQLGGAVRTASPLSLGNVSGADGRHIGPSVSPSAGGPAVRGVLPANAKLFPVRDAVESTPQIDASIMPPRVVEAFRRLGHRVEQHHEVLRARLPDGRVIELPIEQIDVDGSGVPAFQ